MNATIKKSLKGYCKKKVHTQENDNGVNMSPKCFRLFRVQWKANSIGPIEVAEQPLADHWQDGNNKTEHPNPKKDGDGSSPARRQVLERVDDADVLLQSEVSEEKD